MKNFKLTIPEPCHEGWEKMEPNEKGRFCESCCKTVIDFTTKSNNEIKEYFLANRANGICGHFKKSQLDSIVIQIPTETFQNDLSFQKLFLLALLLTMGSMLFSCKTYNGKIQKIEKIEVIDTITKNVVDTLDIVKKDSLINTKIEKYSLVIPKPPIRPQIVIPTKPVPQITHLTGTPVARAEEELIETDTLFKETKRRLNPIKDDVEVFGTFPRFPNSNSKSFEKDIRAFIIKGIEDENLTKEPDTEISFKLTFKVTEKGTINNIDFGSLNNDIVKKTFIKILGKVPKLVSDKANYISKNYTFAFTLKID